MLVFVSNIHEVYYYYANTMQKQCSIIISHIYHTNLTQTSYSSMEKRHFPPLFILAYKIGRKYKISLRNE